MRGLKRHSHDDRRRVIEEIVPLVRRKFGDNLIALAATASYARHEDIDYSDLELAAFVKTMPEGQRWGGVGKIRDGLLVELIWTTKEIYLEDTREVTGKWYLAGSDTLLPIINDDFVNELNGYRVENLRQKCLTRAAKHWHEVQEATAKVLNAALASNRDGIPLLVCDMLRHMLIVASLLNQTPYVTFARFISQARDFKIKPADLDVLFDTVVQGTYQDLRALEKSVVSVFSQFESIFGELGIELYDADLDLN